MGSKDAPALESNSVPEELKFSNYIKPIRWTFFARLALASNKSAPSEHQVGTCTLEGIKSDLYYKVDRAYVCSINQLILLMSIFPDLLILHLFSCTWICPSSVKILPAFSNFVIHDVLNAWHTYFMNNSKIKTTSDVKCYKSIHFGHTLLWSHYIWWGTNSHGWAKPWTQVSI